MKYLPLVVFWIVFFIWMGIRKFILGADVSDSNIVINVGVPTLIAVLVWIGVIIVRRLRSYRRQ